MLLEAFFLVPKLATRHAPQPILTMANLKIRGLRWWMIGLLMLGSIINYLTRSTLAVAAPTLLLDLQISEKQYSWILIAFQITLMLQPFCGYVLDVLGLKRGFAIFAIAWSGLVRRFSPPTS